MMYYYYLIIVSNMQENTFNLRIEIINIMSMHFLRGKWQVRVDEKIVYIRLNNLYDQAATYGKLYWEFHNLIVISITASGT